MLKLTDQMWNEYLTIFHRINSCTANDYSELIENYSQLGDEIESYKVKLENIYSQTDVKEQTFQDIYLFL